MITCTGYNPSKFQCDGEGALETPSLAEETLGNWWLLKEGESLSFGCGAADRLPTPQRMVSTYAYGVSTKLASE